MNDAARNESDVRRRTDRMRWDHLHKLRAVAASSLLDASFQRNPDLASNLGVEPEPELVAVA